MTTYTKIKTDPGRLARAKTPAIRRSIINGRIGHLKKEIAGWEHQIKALLKKGKS